MADRKQFLSSVSDNNELNELLEQIKSQQITEDVLSEQRISFAFGNAMDNASITKESVRKASHSIRIRA